MTYTRKNRGVCSRSTTVTLSDDGIIEHIDVQNGCDGNLTGLCRLMEGQNARDVAQRLRGTVCDDKSTSCPDQIAVCLQEALDKLPG